MLKKRSLILNENQLILLKLMQACIFAAHTTSRNPTLLQRNNLYLVKFSSKLAMMLFIASNGFSCSVFALPAFDVTKLFCFTVDPNFPELIIWWILLTISNRDFERKKSTEVVLSKELLNSVPQFFISNNLESSDIVLLAQRLCLWCI